MGRLAHVWGALRPFGTGCANGSVCCKGLALGWNHNPRATRCMHRKQRTDPIDTWRVSCLLVVYTAASTVVAKTNASDILRSGAPPPEAPWAHRSETKKK